MPFSYLFSLAHCDPICSDDLMLRLEVVGLMAEDALQKGQLDVFVQFECE